MGNSLFVACGVFIGVSVLSFFPRDVLDEIWDLIWSVSEGFRTYFFISLLSNKASIFIKAPSSSMRGWSAGVMVLGKLPVPGRPAYLDNSRTRAYSACSRCGWGLFGHFALVFHFSLLFPALWEMTQYRLKYCLIGPLNPKQPTNQLTQSTRWGHPCRYDSHLVLFNNIVEFWLL